MDPVSIILALALKNPQATTEALQNYNAPGQVDAAQIQYSVSDFAMQTVNCYHKSARFRGVDMLGSPWADQAKFGANDSIVLRINLTGVSGTPYQMIVAAMAKGNSFRTFVIDENTLVPYNKNCELEHWTQATPSP